MPATFSKTARQSARPIEHDQVPEFGDSPARGGGGGRPTKKTPKRCRAILAGIEAGWPYVVACRCARVSYDVFKLWCRIDERFAQEVQLAEARAIQANVF